MLTAQDAGAVSTMAITHSPLVLATQCDATAGSCAAPGSLRYVE